MRRLRRGRGVASGLMNASGAAAREAGRARHSQPRRDPDGSLHDNVIFHKELPA